MIAIDKEALRQAMIGRWEEVLPVADYPPGYGHPCPKCGGNDRFNRGPDFDLTGAVWCRNCFGESSSNNHGDGFSALQWWFGWTFTECLLHVANHLGMKPGSSAEWSPPADEARDLVLEFCQLKRIPSVASLQAFGARIGARPISGGDSLECISVPMFSDIGKECGIQDYHPGNPFPDFVPGDLGAKLMKGMNRPKKSGSRMGLFLPVDGIGSAGRLLMVEGVKDAATLWHYGHRQVIGFPSLNRDALHSVLYSAAGDVQGAFDVVLVPDLDRPGMEKAQSIAEMLSGHPAVASVTMARLPGPLKERGGNDVRDTIRAVGWDAVQKVIENPVPIPGGQRPFMVDDVVEERHGQVVEAFKHLAKLGWDTPWIPAEEQEPAKVYHQGGTIVEVIHRKERKRRGFRASLDGPIVAPLKGSTLSTRLNRAVRFKRLKKDPHGGVDLVAVDSPGWLIANMLDSPALAMQYLRELRAVLTAPTLRADGSILQEPGYDDLSGLLLLPGDYPTIPEVPSLQDAQDAAELIFDLVSEFPCDDASRAAWLAYLLTLMIRPSIDGNVLMWAFTANQAGSGKGLMVDSANRIAFGAAAAVRAYDPDPAETRKGITACLMEGLSAVSFDNIREKVSNTTLEAACTTQVWNDRLLGKNDRNITRPQNLVFSFTGNNLEFGGDMGRRLLMVTLFSAVERPEDRTFRRSNVLEYVDDNRSKFITAALTILRYRWVAAGHVEGRRLLPVLKPIGSFETWSTIIRDSVYLATGIDPWSTNQEVRAADTDEKKLAAIHQAIGNYAGGATSRVIIGSDQPEDRALLEALGIDPAEKGSTIKLGRRLDLFLKRPWRGRQLTKRPISGGFNEYRIVDLKPPG